CCLMTCQTSRRRRDALRPVGPMAPLATRRELTMLRVCLSRMAGGAGGTCRRPGVWLMTLQAVRVTRCCAVRFLRMAAFAADNLRPTVRLVAARALRVARRRGVLLASVAGRALRLRAGMMR